MHISNNLSGLNVVSFESRLADTLAQLIRVQGGHPIIAPAVKEIPLENNSHAFEFYDKLKRGQIDGIIFLTGVGAKALVDALETKYKKEEVIALLSKIPIIVRGPKPTRVLNEWKVPMVATAPEPNTWREVLETIDAHREKFPVKEKTIAVQEYGRANESLLLGLRERGANVLAVPVYRWALPDDTMPLKNAIDKIINLKIQVAVFTTAIQADHLFLVAGQLGVEKELKEAFKKMLIASVGPSCTEVLVEHGLKPDVQPQSPKMGPLIQETAKYAKQILEKK